MCVYTYIYASAFGLGLLTGRIASERAAKPPLAQGGGHGGGGATGFAFAVASPPSLESPTLRHNTGGGADAELTQIL